MYFGSIVRKSTECSNLWLYRRAATHKAMGMAQITHLKLAALKAFVVLGPSYSAAFLTDKMVWVVPTLAASSFFAASIGMANEPLRRQIDEDVDADAEMDDGAD